VFDVAAVLSEFLADEARTELQLPHMTTGQRKQAKKLADEYPEIRCESFGFGPERRLHFFKQGPSPANREGASPKKNSTDDSEERPSSASTSASGRASPLNMSALDDFEPLAPELSVRNTFIHIEGTGISDERVIRSMPHGMFRQCLQEEVAASTTPATDAVPKGINSPPPSSEAPKNIFAPGSEIFVEGLTKFPAFNGLHGKVQSLDEESGRYNVLLVSHDGSAGQCAKIKAENLRIRVPPPPAFESTAERPEVCNPLPGSPQPFPPMHCMAMPGVPQPMHSMPPPMSWQEHQPVLAPAYDQPRAMVYAAR